MKKAFHDKVYRDRGRTASFYASVTSEYIVQPMVPALIKLGIRNPILLTVFSFILVTTASIFLLFLQPSILMNRILIALLIEIVFILDLSDRRLAVKLNRNSFFSIWLDEYFERIGEMVLYTIIGYCTWKIHGYFMYFIMGITTGFLFTYHTILYSLKDSIIYGEIKDSKYTKGMDINIEEADTASVKNVEKEEAQGKPKDRRLFNILAFVFFYLNMGLGERYLYPIIFIIINRTTIMLPIVLILTLFKSVKETVIMAQRIKNDESIAGG